MRLVTQSRVGDNGTCFRSCIASIFDVPESDVVDFDGPRKYMHNATELDDYWANVQGWLGERGLRYRRVPLSGSKPSGYSTIEGISPRGGLHACVAYDGKLVHDPHPLDGTGRGLLEPRYYGLLEPTERGQAKDGVLSRALLLAALLAWYKERKVATSCHTYNLAEYKPRRRAFDGSLPLNRYPMHKILDALGIDIKEYMRRTESQKTELLRTAIEHLDKARRT
jgi:hypothetical protein